MRTDREIVEAELTKLAASVRRRTADEIAQAILATAERYVDLQAAGRGLRHGAARSGYRQGRPHDMSGRIRKLRWKLAKRVYWSPLRPLWSYVAPPWTAEEIAEIHRRADEHYEQMRRYWE